MLQLCRSKRQSGNPSGATTANAGANARQKPALFKPGLSEQTCSVYSQGASPFLQINRVSRAGSLTPPDGKGDSVSEVPDCPRAPPTPQHPPREDADTRAFRMNPAREQNMKVRGAVSIGSSRMPCPWNPPGTEFIAGGTPPPPNKPSPLHRCFGHDSPFPTHHMWPRGYEGHWHTGNPGLCVTGGHRGLS